jgi:hypothetical protein
MLAGGLLGAAALTTLAGCGSRAACFGLSDAAAVDRIARDYASLPPWQRGDPEHMMFAPSRVLGVGRNGKPKNSGQAFTQFWFSQDDRTLTVATLMQDCKISYRPGITPDAIKDAATPVSPPRF